MGVNLASRRGAIASSRPRTAAAPTVAPAHRGGSAVNPASLSQASFAVPSGAVAGDLAIVHIHRETATAITAPSGWTSLTSMSDNTNSGNTGYGFDDYYKVLTSSDLSANWVFTWSGAAYTSGYAEVISGPNTTQPFDVTRAAAEQSTAVTTGPALSLTGLSPYTLLLHVEDIANGTTFTPPSGFTRVDPFTTNALICVSYQVLTAGGSSGTVQTTDTHTYPKKAALYAIRGR